MIQDDQDQDAYVLTNPTTIPCFRSSLLWGIGGGLAIGFHKFRASRNVIRSIDFGMRTFGATTVISWVMCRANFFGRRMYQKEMVERLNRPPTDSQSFLPSQPINQENVEIDSN